MFRAFSIRVGPTTTWLLKALILVKEVAFGKRIWLSMIVKEASPSLTRVCNLMRGAERERDVLSRLPLCMHSLGKRSLLCSKGRPRQVAKAATFKTRLLGITSPSLGTCVDHHYPFGRIHFSMDAFLSSQQKGHEHHQSPLKSGNPSNLDSDG